jgi:O-antigen ligase
MSELPEKKSMKLFEHIELNNWLLCFYVFFLPFFIKGSIIVLALLTVNLFRSRDSLRNIKNIFKKKILLFLFLYYLVHVAALAYSENFNYGFFDLQIKFSFFLVPLLFASMSHQELKLDRIKVFFISGCVVSFFISLINSIRLYLKEHWFADFYYNHFSFFNHPTYITIYVNMALLLIIDGYFSRWTSLDKNSKRIISFVSILLACAVILYSSRAASLICLISVVLLIIIKITREPSRRYNMIKLGFIFIALVLVIQFISLRVFNRYSEIVTHNDYADSLRGNQEVIFSETDNSTSSRLIAWKYSIELFRNNWFLGVGTGDIQDELVKKYSDKKWEYGVEKKLNPHNQFLHTSVALGILGLISLLANFIYPIYFSLKGKYWLYMVFIFIVFANCLAESVLEVQAGVMMFPFFTCLFYKMYSNTNNLI